jgi:hypothetical protein
MHTEVANYSIKRVVIEGQSLRIANAKVDMRMQSLRFRDHAVNKIDADYLGSGFTGNV